MTGSGMQVHHGMQAGSAACGPVLEKAVDLPPVPAKWEQVPLLNTLRTKVERKVRGRWVEVEARDLARMRFSETPSRELVLAGLAVSGAKPVISASSEYNHFKALCARVFRPPRHRPQPGAWDLAWQFSEVLLPKLDTEPMTEDEWLESVEARRRKILRRAWEAYRRSGWQEKFRRFKAFVKKEKMPGFAKKGGELVPAEEMIDRLIQGPEDTTHVIAGPVLKPLIGALKRAWGLESPIFYASRGPAVLQQWLDDRLAEGEFSCFASDYTMFDNSHSAQSWGFMERIYRRGGCYVRPDFAKVMEAWRRPGGCLAGKGWALRYQAAVMNASGRDDTSLANAILNGFAAYLSASAAWHRVPIRQLTQEMVRGTPVKLAVCGDDSLGFMPQLGAQEMAAFKVAFSANLAFFGLDAGPEKVVMATEPKDIVFLGMRPYPVGGKLLWGRTIGRALYKLGWSMVTDADWAATQAGVLEAVQTCEAHVPILSDIAYAFLLAHGKGKRLEQKKDDHRPWRDLTQKAPSYDQSTLQYVAMVYHTTVEALRAEIEALRELRNFPCTRSSALLRSIIYQDEL